MQSQGLHASSQHTYTTTGQYAEEDRSITVKNIGRVSSTFKLVPEQSVSYLLQPAEKPQLQLDNILPTQLGSCTLHPHPQMTPPPPPLMFTLHTGSCLPCLASSRALVPCRHNLTQVCQPQTYPCPVGRGGRRGEERRGEEKRGEERRGEERRGEERRGEERRGEERRGEERRGEEKRGEVNRRGERRGEEGKREYRRRGEGRQLKH